MALIQHRTYNRNSRRTLTSGRFAKLKQRLDCTVSQDNESEQRKMHHSPNHLAHPTYPVPRLIATTKGLSVSWCFTGTCFDCWDAQTKNLVKSNMAVLCNAKAGLQKTPTRWQQLNSKNNCALDTRKLVPASPHANPSSKNDLTCINASN